MTLLEERQRSINTMIGCGVLALACSYTIFYLTTTTNSKLNRLITGLVGASLTFGVVGLLDKESTHLRRKIQAITDLNDQIDVQQAWEHKDDTPLEPLPINNQDKISVPDGLKILSWDDFVKNYINQPKVKPHFGVFSPTGTGKTLVAEVIGDLRARVLGADTRQVYLSPTVEVEDKEFLGWEVVGNNFDAESMNSFSEYVNASLLERYSNPDYHEPLVIVCDEYRWTAKKTEVTPVVGDVLSIGRKQNLNIILTGVNYLVKTLGMEGESDLRANMTMVLKGELAVKHLQSLENAQRVPPGTVNYFNVLSERNPYRACVVDNAIMLLPDMSTYRRIKKERGIGYVTPETPSVVPLNKPIGKKK